MTFKSIADMCQHFQSETFDDRVIRDYLNNIATMHDDRIQKALLREIIGKYVILEKKVDGLLKNTLPEDVANEIKYGGGFSPRAFDCTIVFADIVRFTQLAELLPAERLIELLDDLFREMDDLVVRFHGTKIKTIGDAYMAVFGAPREYDDHALMAVRTGMALLNLVDAFNRRREQGIEIRVGIHTGKVIAGVVGKERMQFDVFGNNVNIASRFESSGEKGRVTVSYETYNRTRNFFEFEERPDIAMKTRSQIKAYLVTRERS